MNRLFYLLGAAGLLLVAGCRKDDVVDCPPAATTSNAWFADLVRQNGAPVQTFTLTLGAGAQTFTTSSGAQLTFPGASFLLPNGTAATGAAQVRVREIYSVPDMVLSNMPTQIAGNRRLLISGGEFSIQVWQNSSRLRLAPGTPRVLVQAPISAASGPGLSTPALLWQQPATRLVGDSAGWVRPASRTDSVRLTATTYALPIPLDSISWWNIDRLWPLYQSAPLGTVTIQVPTIPAGATGSSYVFMRAVGYNGLARLLPNNATQTSWAGQLPIGASMVAAVLQSINGQLYFGSQPLTTQNNLVVTPTLAAVSAADAVRLIKQL
jgi:hypothetical protein